MELRTLVFHIRLLAVFCKIGKYHGGLPPPFKAFESSERIWEFGIFFFRFLL